MFRANGALRVVSAALRPYGRLAFPAPLRFGRASLASLCVRCRSGRASLCSPASGTRVGRASLHCVPCSSPPPLPLSGGFPACRRFAPPRGGRAVFFYCLCGFRRLGVCFYPIFLLAASPLLCARFARLGASISIPLCSLLVSVSCLLASLAPYGSLRSHPMARFARILWLASLALSWLASLTPPWAASPPTYARPPPQKFHFNIIKKLKSFFAPSVNLSIKIQQDNSKLPKR